MQITLQNIMALPNKAKDVQASKILLLETPSGDMYQNVHSCIVCNSQKIGKQSK